jgi:hypothetical protein
MAGIHHCERQAIRCKRYSGDARLEEVRLLPCRRIGVPGLNAPGLRPFTRLIAGDGDARSHARRQLFANAVMAASLLEIETVNEVRKPGHLVRP